MVIIDGTKVKKPRTEKGILQKDLARMLNVLQSTLSRWENSTKFGLTDENALVLCNALDCKKEDLKKDKEADIKRNAEGYYDQTADQAIKSCEDRRTFWRGEIYEYIDAKGQNKSALVLSSNDREEDWMISIVMLYEEGKARWSVPVVCGQMMYARCNMVSYCHKDRLGNYIRTATDEEMEAVDAMIANALGLSLGISATEWKAAAVEWEVKCHELFNDSEKEKADLRFEIERLKNTLDAERAKPTPIVSDDIIRLTVERDMYKMFYEDVIRKGAN